MAINIRLRQGSETETSPAKSAGVAVAESERVELEGRRKYFSLRTVWSGWIIAWISILIIFNLALTVATGAKLLDFENYKWFITIVTVETFLQIVGMGYIAVKFLFSK